MYLLVENMRYEVVVFFLIGQYFHIFIIYIIHYFFDMKVACPNTITTSLARLPSGLLFVYFGWPVGLSLEIYFGLSFNDRKLILLRERFALKPGTSSMF